MMNWHLQWIVVMIIELQFIEANITILLFVVETEGK